MIFMHYFGNNSYLYDGDTFLSLNDEQTDLLDILLESNTIEEIIEEFKDDYTDEEQVILYQNIIEFKNYIDQSTHLFSKKRVLKKSGKKDCFYPISLILELTNYCNFCCDFCYKNAAQKNKQYLDLKVIKYLISNYKGLTPMIHLTGGEPTSHPYFEEIVDLLSEDFIIKVTTNGSLMDKMPINILKKINEFQISVYGYNEDSYLTNTKDKRGFSKLEKSLKLLNEIEAYYYCSIVATNEFKENFISYFDFLQKNNVINLNVGTITKVGRARTNYNDKDMEDLNFINECIVKYQHIFKFRNNSQVFDLDSEQSDYTNNQQGIECDCGSGKLKFTIDEYGTLKYCPILPNKYFDFGNYKLLGNYIKKPVDNDFFIKCKNKYFEQKNIESDVNRCRFLCK